MYTSETHTSAIGFALFGHCHYLLTDPRILLLLVITILISVPILMRLITLHFFRYECSDFFKENNTSIRTFILY